jgi:23S rRNA pseudouridine1911/1915/1917 synthase
VSSFVVTVPAALGGVRLDRAVSMLTGVPRSVAAALVASGQVLVDGRPVSRGSVQLAAGTELSVALPAPPGGALAPEASVALAVVHEDAELVVVDKPAGVVVHPGAGHSQGTLIAGLLARYPDIAALGSGPCDPGRPGIVHRLDRGTSGLLVVARTPVAYRSLAAQMKARTVGRRYVVLVAGHVVDEHGMIDAPIGRSTRSPTRMAITPDGRPARTTYRVLERLDTLHGDGPVAMAATLLACALDTGRTHQIRVHLAAIGHPVVGEDRYVPGRRRVGAGLLGPGRLFLHAGELAIDHPVTGTRLRWESPAPPDLAHVIGGAPVLPSPDGAD